MPLYREDDAKPIPIGEFAPDRDLDTPGLILDANGAQPGISGFSPLPNPTSLGDSLEEQPIGTYFAHYSDRTVRVFASTASAVFYLDPSTGWGTALSLSNVSGIAVFAQFGDDVLLVGPGLPGVRRVFRAANKATTFTEIAGSPVDPLTIAVVGGQALAFAGQEWFSSAAGNVADWAPSVATLSATGSIYDIPGPIVASSFIYRNALAWKEDGLFLGQQVGPPLAWSWKPISGIAGTWGQGCIVRLPNAVAYLGVDDFYITMGYAPERIPNYVKEWFFATVNPDKLARTIGWYDVLKSTIYWHFISREAPMDMPDMFVSYNRRAKRWCVGHLNTPAVSALGSSTARITSSQLTPCVIFNDSYAPETLCALTGGAGAMALTTGYYGTESIKTSLVKFRVKYDDAPTTEMVQMFKTEKMGGADNLSGMMIYNSGDGWHYGMQYDRWHKFVIATSGACDVSGILPKFRAGGTR